MMSHQLWHTLIYSEILPCFETASLVAEDHDGMESEQHQCLMIDLEGLQMKHGNFFKKSSPAFTPRSR